MQEHQETERRKIGGGRGSNKFLGKLLTNVASGGIMSVGHTRKRSKPRGLFFSPAIPTSLPGGEDLVVGL